MAFTASDVKALREKTGVGMMDCKKALVESDGDMDKAIDFLREKGLAAATKKASRIAAEGVVMAYTDEAKQTSVIIEVNSETDFVAKNDKFQSFVLSVAKTVINEDPKDVDDLLTKKLDGSDRTVQENLQDMVLAIGENMKIRRFERVTGIAATYIHAGGAVGVLVSLIPMKRLPLLLNLRRWARTLQCRLPQCLPLILTEQAFPQALLNMRAR